MFWPISNLYGFDMCCIQNVGTVRLHPHRHQPLPVSPDTTHHSMPWSSKACGVWASTGSVMLVFTTHEYFTGSCLPFLHIHLICTRFSILCLYIYIHTYIQWCTAGFLPDTTHHNLS